MERLLLRVHEAAEVAGISRSKAYELLASGAWPKVIVGKSVRVPQAGLREWVERETIARQPQSGGHTPVGAR